MENVNFALSRTSTHATAADFGRPAAAFLHERETLIAVYDGLDVSDELFVSARKELSGALSSEEALAICERADMCLLGIKDMWVP